MLALLLLATSCSRVPPEGESAGTAGESGGTGAVDSVGDSAADSGRDSGGDSGGDSGTPVPEGPALVFDGEKPKNLLMISLDTTRRDQVGYFSGLDTTPNLDALMAESVVLEDHRSCSSWTAPSVLCLLLGYDPVNQGWYPTQMYEEFGGDPGIPWVPDDIHPLAEQFSDAGYKTLLLTANGVYSDRLGGGLANGFQEVRLPLWFPAPDVAPKVLTAATEMLADGRPWYLAAHFIDPHAPFKAPAEYATDLATLGPFPWEVDDEKAYLTIESEWSTMTDAEQELAVDYFLTIYRAELRYWDETFGTLWADLDAMGALDDTLVVFFTDHGEQFHDHGGWHHGVSLWEEENRSTVFFWAKNLKSNRWMGSTTHEDLAPTVLDIFDFEPNPDHTGIKIGDAPSDRTILTFNYIYGWGQPRNAYIADGYKLAYNWVGEKFLYDLANDPGETTNHYSADNAVALEMWDVLLPEVERIQTQWPTLVPVDPGP